MALVKPAHLLFTDREEPRKAFWQTLRKLEETPDSHQIITYYGEGGIGKTWLLNELKRNIDHMNVFPFEDGFSFQGEYISVLYDLETSTDPVEVLCHLRYRLLQVKPDLVFPIFDTAVKKYKEITGLSLSIGENQSSSALAKYEEMLDTAALFIPGLGTLADLYAKVKKGGEILAGILNHIEDKQRKELYREYFEAITYSETAEDLRRNMVEFFKADLQHSERDCGIVFLIDTFELLQKSVIPPVWFTQELTDIRNTCWVLAGRNKIYSTEANEHLLGELSFRDASDYLQKEGISDPEIIEKIYEAAGGAPIYLYLSAVNYKQEGRPSAADFQNLDKAMLLERYIRGLGSEEKTVIRLMATMSHWTERDYKEVFEKVHGSFLPYSEAYHSLLQSTMVSRDDESRYYLHRAARVGIFEDKNYPEDVRRASLSALLNVYNERLKKREDLHYYRERVSDLLDHCREANVLLDDGDHELLHDIFRRLCRNLYAYGTGEIRQLESAVERNKEKLCKTVLSRALWDDELGEMQRYCGDYEKAIVSLDRAVEGYRQVYPKNNRIYLVCLNERAMAYSYAGYRQKALALKEEIYELDKEIYGPEHSETLAVQGNLGYEYCTNGQPEKAVSVLQEVIEKRKKIKAEDDPGILANLHNLALAYGALNDHPRAIAIFEEVWQKRKRVLGEDHPETLLAMRTLANEYRLCGKYEEALELLQAVYPKQKAALGEADPDTITTLNSTANVYLDQKRYEEALQIYQQIYETARTNLGEKSDLTLSLLNNTAVAYTGLKEFTKARDIYRQVWEIRKAKLGPSDRIVLVNLWNLCWLEKDLGDDASALEHFEEYHRHSKALFGEEYPNAMRTLSALSDLYYKLKDYRKELPVEEELVRLRRKKLGNDHPDTLLAIHNLALTCSRLKQYERAASLDEETYRKRREILGEEHAGTMMTVKNLKAVYTAWIRTENDLQKQKEIYEKGKALFGEEDPDVLTLLNYLAVACSNAHRPEAMALKQEVYEKRKKILGENDPQTLVSLSNLAFEYGRTEDKETYLKLSRCSYEKRKEVLGADHPDTITSFSNLSYACEKNGLCEEAITIRQEVLKKRRDIFGDDHRETYLALNSLADLYYLLKEYGKALPLYEETYALCQKHYGEKDGHTLHTLRRLEECRKALS
ncbi:MAG: tetratricopeptide repeat protein [Erysipelotrichaceae bacterium]|nr:tetratricopeptide repeat protein [Erysipelotrichaceae bacterium]